MSKRLLKAFLLCFTLPLTALPVDPIVVSGSVSFAQSGTKLSVMQTSETAILEWNDFVLGEQEEIKFFLPEDASILNRVKGNSMIDGSLSCNGDLYFASQRGISIGQSAQVYSGRFFASTLDLLDPEYLAASSILYFDQASGGIVLRGRIETFEGSLALLAPQLDLDGTLRAPEGTVILGAASRIFLCGCGEQKVWLMAGAGDVKWGGDCEAYKVEARCRALEARGEIQALERIVFGAEEKLTIQGVLSTQSGLGGEIHLIGREISIQERAVVDASGEMAGGVVLVGGDFNSSFPKASRLNIASSAQIHADARATGHGGKAILYAESENWFEGSVSARGGRLGGNGGVVAIVSPGTLHAAGSVSLEAPQGKAGEYLQKL